MTILNLQHGLRGTRPTWLWLARLSAICFSTGLVAQHAPSAKARQGEAAQATTRQAMVANLRAHIHHVFVVYQENRSFDSYFGTFPGADNLATTEAQEHGFRQWDAIGKEWITPFLRNAADTRDADHSRDALLAKSDDGRM
ncbi:MAG TPA: alkaline phosphatase family protein, partial [Terracidiphilus sp.]|nr:alkaline phosphatase family protein [Terracidiphilus sp.]